MMDQKKMESGLRLFLEGVGERFEGDDLEATPGRAARAWYEDLLSGYAADPVSLLTSGPAPPGTGLVLVRDISFQSVCVHHLLPFFGHVHVAYLPGARLAGLSKIGRAVDALSRRLQIQERLTGQIRDALDRALEPRGVLVVAEALHTCMVLRGVRKESSRFTTLAHSGAFDEPSRRDEVVRLIGSPGRGDSAGCV